MAYTPQGTCYSIAFFGYSIEFSRWRIIIMWGGQVGDFYSGPYYKTLLNITSYIFIDFSERGKQGKLQYLLYVYKHHEYMAERLEILI
jgi:hypothetical protein